MFLDLDPIELPTNAVEVARVAGAFGIQGWLKITPHSASPEALFSCRQWILLPPLRAPGASASTPSKNTAHAMPTMPVAAGRQPAGGHGQSALVWPGAGQGLQLRIREVKWHGQGQIVARAHGIDNRDAVESLKHARIFVPRTAFPTPDEGEYYWVDLLGCLALNRQGEPLGEVVDLLSSGAQTTLVLRREEDGRQVETLVPFVAAYVDEVNVQEKRLLLDWQRDY